MDALEFLKERNRMCHSYKGCGSCPLVGNHCTISHATTNEDCERIIAAVEQWSKEHPRKTRQSIFLEQYPEACIGNDGVLRVCPCSISASHRDVRGNCATMRRECYDCRREFWMQEVE